MTATFRILSALKILIPGFSTSCRDTSWPLARGLIVARIAFAGL